jgi:hypothetical protein
MYSPGSAEWLCYSIEKRLKYLLKQKQLRQECMGTGIFDFPDASRMASSASSDMVEEISINREYFQPEGNVDEVGEWRSNCLSVEVSVVEVDFTGRSAAPFSASRQKPL